MRDAAGRVTGGEQPRPQRGGLDVTPVARGLFLQMLLERELKGIETYGTTLQTENGRDAVQDALEEAIDLWQYLVQISLERDALRARLWAAEAELDAARETIARYAGSQPAGAPGEARP